MRSSAACLVVLAALAVARPATGEAPFRVKSTSEVDLVRVETNLGESLWLGRCATAAAQPQVEPFAPGPAYCTTGSLTPDVGFVPGDDDGYLIDVWVHILQHTNGDGNVPNAEVYEQMGILNEDFRAIPSSNGASGIDTRLYFRVAGITRTTNNTYYADTYNYSLTNNYFDVLAMDPLNYLNIYTNNTSALGYAFVPQTLGGDLGTTPDRVVIYWRAFGAGNGFVPYDDGRTTTHEVGHFLGLWHTFADQVANGCDTGAGCNNSGDTACDTNQHNSPDFVGLPSCTAPTTDCAGGAGVTPVENYMNYSDDLCMTEFTSEQMQRMRCSLDYYRTQIGTPVLFYDGFENASTNAWSATS
jgi:hypothetical protein